MMTVKLREVLQRCRVEFPEEQCLGQRRALGSLTADVIRATGSKEQVEVLRLR
jgi:hypothetical protein